MTETGCDPFSYLTVADLISMLQQTDPQRPVLVASDEEGNSFRPVNGMGTVYVSESVRLQFGTEIEQTYSSTKEAEDEEAGQVRPAIVLWP